MVFLQQEKWPDEANNFIFVRSDRQMHKVLFKDILVVEGLENYVCIYTESTAACTFYHEKAYDRGSSWWSISASP